MATISGQGSSIPFTLPLEIDDHVGVSKNMLSLKFNLHVGAMYIKQEMYIMDRYIRENMIQKNRSEDGHV